MCAKKDTCPMYLEYCNTDKMNDVCANCTFLQKAKRTAKYAKIGLLLAVMAFLTSTYLLY